MHKLVQDEKWFANSFKNMTHISFNSHLTNVMRGSTTIDKKLQMNFKKNDKQEMMKKKAL